MFAITKDFDFCYGHRVHSQTLNAELSCNQPCKCRHLHGHQGKITIKLKAYYLKNGMVTDFHHLNWFKAWLDDHFDHKMIIDKADPLLPTLLPEGWSADVTDTKYWKKIAPRDGLEVTPFYVPQFVMQEGLPHYEKELLEGLVLVSFVPTSENLSYFFFSWTQLHLYDHVAALGDAELLSVTFQETPKTSALFTK